MTDLNPVTDDLQPEIRVDALSGRRSIICAHRSQRPGSVRPEPELTSTDSTSDPFMEGAEHNTPHERFALRRTDSSVDGRGWLLRVVPNRYPSVLAGTDGTVESSPRDPLCVGRQPRGVHDVIIECPDDRTRLTDLSAAEVLRVLYAWQMRLQQLSDLPLVQHVSLFRNEGFSAGASLPHCHSQIMGLDFIPDQIGQRIERAAGFRRMNGQELVEAVRHRESEIARRIVRQSDQFLTLCPWSSRVSWHVQWLPAAEKNYDFARMETSVLAELAAQILSVVRSITDICGRISMNIAVVLPPLNHVAAFPWSLELLPRNSRIAGFEMITDVDIVTVAPEEAACQLREKTVWVADPEARAALFPVGYHWTVSRAF